MLTVALYLVSVGLSFYLHSWWPIGSFLGGIALIMAWYVVMDRFNKD
ncbi:protein of unknown function [Burkholderia multivorans]